MAKEQGIYGLKNTEPECYDDGRPYDAELFPEGMTGWIRDHK